MITGSLPTLENSFFPASARVSDSPGGGCGWFSVGGISVALRGSTDITSPLEPFRIPCCNPDIDIKIERTLAIEPKKGHLLFDSGSVWKLFDDGSDFRFDFSVPAFGDIPYRRFCIDSRYRCATLQVSERYVGDRLRAPHPMEYPLDELLIMHRLTQERAIELHGTGIVRANGVGNLFVGHSGAGKSTTTRLWTSMEDVEVLSDDRIIVRPETGATDRSDQIEILRLRAWSASRSNHCAQDDSRKGEEARRNSTAPGPMRMYGTPWHGEAMFASPNSAPLARIFILEHGHGNIITHLSPSQAVAELFARAFVPFHRHEYVEAGLSFLEQLAASVPVYRYDFEPDERAIKKIQDFQD